MRVEVVAVDLAEPVGGVRFAAEELEDADPGDALLEERIDAREADADVARGVADAAAEEECGAHDEGHDRERDEGEAPVEGEHRAHDENEGEDVAEDGDDAGAEEFVQRLDVVGHAGHEPTDGVAVEEGQAEALEVAERLAAQVVHDALSEPGREQRLGVREREGQGQRDDEGDGEPPEERGVARRDGVVDRDLGQPGPDELERRARDQHRDRTRHAPAIGAHVAEQAAHEVVVVLAVWSVLGHG